MCNQNDHNHNQDETEKEYTFGQETDCNQQVCCSQMSDMQASLTECTAQLAKQEKNAQEWQHKCMVAMADFENFKRRTAKDMENIRQQAHASLLNDLLSIVDDFDRALALPPSLQEDLSHDSTLAGVALIRKSLDKILSSYGVVPMDNYTDFNPEFHEALAQVPADEQHASGSIVTVMQKGYVHHGTVLRYAKVSVAE